MYKKLIPALIALLIFASSSAANSTEPNLEWGVGVFFARSLDLNQKRLDQNGLTLHTSGPVAEYSFCEIKWRVEAMLAGFSDYAHGQGVAVLPGLRVLFSDWAARPYLEAGIGPSLHNMSIPELGTAFNFLSYGGLGLRLAIDDTASLDFGYRVTHLSNAGITEENHGVTSNLLQLGISLKF